MVRRILISLILLFMILVGSCIKKDSTTKELKAPSKKTMENVNKFLVDKDAEVIKSYADRRGWKMEVTESGLWYTILNETSGKKVETHQTVELKYNVWLLDGTLCYSSDSTGIKSFKVGSGGVELGLEQGVLLLRKGNKARFIMPPHLAYGLLGDENRIPARSTIVYEVELLQVID